MRRIHVAMAVCLAVGVLAVVVLATGALSSAPAQAKGVAPKDETQSGVAAHAASINTRHALLARQRAVANAKRKARLARERAAEQIASYATDDVGDSSAPQFGPGVAGGSAYRSSGGVPGELESIAQCESGGDYNAVNPSSGAYGKYQIMPSTAQSYGCDLSTPGGQDECATRIYAGGSGRGQWVC